MRKFTLHISFFIAFLLFAADIFADEAKTDSTKSAQAQDSIPLTASLIIAEPGEGGYNVCGHAAIRLQSPTNGLDWIFSYEVPEVNFKHVLSFLSGYLRQGMIAAPSANYIEMFNKQGRQMKEYELNLNFRQKQKLWQICDQRLMMGLASPYDYINEGCARQVVNVVGSSLLGERINYSENEQLDNLSRKDLFRKATDNYPWSQFIWYFIYGDLNDSYCTTEMKLVIPANLVEEWSKATIVDTLGNPRPLIKGKPAIISASNGIISRKAAETENTAKTSSTFSPLSPVCVFCILLIATVICCIIEKRNNYKKGVLSNILDIVISLVQIIPGALLTYLLIGSTLVATGWNTLFIIYNPLHLIFLLANDIKPLSHKAWRNVYALYSVVIVAFIATTVFTDYLSLAHILLIAVFGIRSIFKVAYHQSKMTHTDDNK
jgi:hypothetical protein